MIIHTDPSFIAPALNEMVARAERILLLSHINPDGDAIGSMLGVWHTLHAMHKTAIPLASSALPSFALSLPGIEQVQVYERGTPLPDADLIWLVDTATLARVGPIHDDHAATLSSRPLIIVDHHVTNEGEGTLNLIDAGAASCAELVYTLLRAMNAPVTADGATCLLMGMTTDTQSFQTNSTRPETLRIAAGLLEAGAHHQTVVRNIYYATPYSTAQLLGLALSQMQCEDGLLWTIITQEMMQQTGADDGAYDDVLMVMQRVEGVRACVLFKEREDGKVKLSLRSTPDLNVAVIAKTWGGGGHAQAAGATLPMDLAAAAQMVLPVMHTLLKNDQQEYTG